MKKKIRSHVKRLKAQNIKHPMSPGKYRKKLRIARRKDFFRIFLRVVGCLVIALAVLFIAGNMFMYKKTGETLFSCAKEAKEIVGESSPDDFRRAETTFIYSSDGTKIAELAEDEDATYLTYDEIPANVINAFVAVEDRTFWKNSGVDYKGIARVLLNYIKSRGTVSEGASTITQQLARGVYLSNEKTMLRKVREIFIARQLTKKYSKEDIMEFYCNTCCFANGIYGVEDAAEKYFSRHINELTLSETAYICAIPNRPEYYNPLKEPENALTRRDKILNDMEECGYISGDACQLALAETVTVLTPEEANAFYNYETTYAINCAVRYLMKQDGFEFRYEFDSDDDYNSYANEYDEYYAQAKHKLYTGGYEVYTTIDLDAQDAMQEILDEQLSFSDSLTSEGIYELQGAMTVIDNSTGKVTAIIGGRTQEGSDNVYSLNRAYQGYAQPGSSFKPIAVYTPALCSGYNPNSILKNIDVDEAKTSNYEDINKMDGNDVTLRSAVEKSLNGCAYWLFNQLTPRLGLSYVTNMGFTKIMPGDYTLSAALGGLTYGVTTVEMANAYYTLENHGEYIQTDCIDSIYDSDGNNIYKGYETKTIYDREAADEMTDVMEGVLTDGTASNSSWYSYTGTEAAGKTGTTNDNKAGWFCGYTPYYTIAVWVGCDTPKTVNGLQGGTYPLYIWKEAMLEMIDGLPARYFDLQFDTSGWDTAVEDEEESPDEVIDDEETEEDEETDEITDAVTDDVPDSIQGDAGEPDEAWDDDEEEVETDSGDDTGNADQGVDDTGDTVGTEDVDAGNT
ncbi:MAG: transglycosylase domain-containing protein [Clostridiales bacterium]|nr:transglycosylase domain-containing protein [Clostridiales bacterium]